MIDRLVESIPNAEKGFRLLFSATPFPGYTVKLEWRREEYGGNWYYSPQFEMEGWLCPALFRYSDKVTAYEQITGSLHDVAGRRFFTWRVARRRSTRCARPGLSLSSRAFRAE